jgi:hypothetical protein
MLEFFASINWTTVLASCFTAVIISASQFISNRYLARMLDRIERGIARNERISIKLNGKKNSNTGDKQEVTQNAKE